MFAIDTQCDVIESNSLTHLSPHFLDFFFFVIVHAAAVPIGINKNFTLIKILIYAKLG